MEVKNKKAYFDYEILKEYEAAPVADEQMRELFTMGFHDKNL